jgi:tRNA A58 N-methylase Trm61
VFLLNEKEYTIPPRGSRELTSTGKWVVRFHQGGERGETKKVLDGGDYSFLGTKETGWFLEETRVDPIETPIYAPTPQYIVDAMLRIAKVKPTDVVADLGCGDGRIPITAAKTYGCKASGIEIQKDLVDKALQNVKDAKLEGKVKIYHTDMFNVTLENVDVVTLYLETELLDKLVPLLKKMPEGSRVVSYAHSIVGLENERKIVVPEKIVYNMVPDMYDLTPKTQKHTVYLYTIGD